MNTEGDVWPLLVTTALLGTDRRDPPPPAGGPIAGLVGDLVLIAGDAAPDARFLNHVAVTTLARRAARRPDPPAPLLRPPPPDRRALCPSAAVEMWHRVVDDWPVLEDEWLLLAAGADVALPGDLLIELLERHRRDGVRAARVVAIAGPVAAWVIEHVPTIVGDGGGRPRRNAATADPGDRGGGLHDAADMSDGRSGLPDLPIPAELAPLLDADAATFAGTLRSYLETGELDASHRRVLVNLIARCRTAVLDETIDVVGPLAAHDGVAATITDVARRRRDMLLSFETAHDDRDAPRTPT